MATAEWRDVRFTGSFIPKGSTETLSIDRTFRLAGQPDQFGVTTGIMTNAIEQDVTPTFTQASAGESGFNVVSPTASDAFASATGTHGLEESSDQPGDLTRLFYGTVDGSRTHHMTAQRTGPYTANGAGVCTWTGGAGFGPLHNSKITAISDTSNGITSCVVKDSSVGPTYGYYVFNRATGAFVRAAVAWDVQQNTFATSGAPTFVSDAANLVSYVQIGSKVWLPVAAVAQLKDVIGGATVTTDAAVQFYVRLGDRLHTFSYDANGSVLLNPFDISATGALTRTQNSSLINVTGGITTPGALVGACVSKGFIILATDRNLYSISFDDTNRRYVVSLITNLPLGVTGKPVEFGLDVWVPCGNRLFRFTVGKDGQTWLPVDPHGGLPNVYGNGDIVQLVPTFDRLVMRQVLDTATAVLMTLDGGSAVATIRWSDAADNATTSLAELSQNPVLPILSYGEPLILINRTVNSGNSTLLDSVVVPNGTRSPRGMPVLNRQQVAKAYGLWPFQYGVNRLAKKTPTRLACEVEDVGSSASGLTVDVYVQYDYENKAATQTFGTGPLTGTGTWHSVCSVSLESLNIDQASGAGVLWTELTNATGDYTLCQTRYRHCAVINGDATGAHLPELRSIVIQRYEWVDKGYLSQFRLRLLVEDGNIDTPEMEHFGVYEDPDDIEDAVDDLKALNDHNVICTVWPVGSDDLHSFKGVITKFNRDPQHQNIDGVTHELITLSVQHVVPVGIYADVLL